MAGRIQASLAVRLLGCIQINHLVPNILIAPATHTEGMRPKAGAGGRNRWSESKGKHMAAIMIAAVIVFIAGVGAGIIAVVSAGIHREERDLARRRYEPDFTLALQAPDRMTYNVRKVAGLHVLDLDADVDSREEILV
jgi:hypothetical protein